MTRIRDRFRRNPYLWMAACCFLVLAFRAWRRLGHMEIWAEDGNLYLEEALAMGLGSVGLSYGGFYHVIQRVLLIALTWLLPMTWLAAGVNLSYILIYTAIVAIPIQREYEWIIPSMRARCALCLTFCLAPGLNEMLGNYANLAWVFFFYLAFLGLRDPDSPIRAWEFALSIFLIASMGQAMFVIPLFAWRVYEGLRQRRRGTWTSAAILASLVASTFLLWLVREARFAAVPKEPAGQLLWVYAKTTADSLLVGLLGDRAVIAMSAMSTPLPRMLGIALAFGLLGAGVLRVFRRPEGRAVFAFTAGVLAWPVVSWFARPGNLIVFDAPLNSAFMAQRYAFPSAVAVSLLWMFLLHASGLSQSWKSGLSIGLVVLAVGFGGNRFWIKEYGSERRWERLAPKIDAALRDGCPNPVFGEIYPDNWVFYYRDPNRPRC